MNILNQLPIHDKPIALAAPVGAIAVYPGQMIFRASLTPDNVNQLSGSEAKFPVIIDTGNSFNFAIRQSHINLWIGNVFQQIGDIRVSGATVPRCGANLWIHPNLKGAHTLSGAKPVIIKLKGGMAVYPDDLNPTRLPILGMRAITSNKLKLFVNGEKGYVDLKQGWL